MAESLKKQFPGEEGAIDEFMRLMKVGKRELFMFTMEWRMRSGARWGGSKDKTFDKIFKIPRVQLSM